MIVNTLIKYNSEDYTFKIGVRELGWRIKQTLNQNRKKKTPQVIELVGFVCFCRLLAFSSSGERGNV